MSTYRIAFVNPYVTAAEVQAFESLRRAAEAQGIVIEHRKPKDLREDDAYDFLIPVAFTPKTTSHPSLLSCHSPRAVYVDSEEMFGAIASHDGYLTISENLKSFFGGLCAAYDKPLTSVGDYYNCPQRTDIPTDIAGLARSGDLALCYFGINWDMRAEPLFRALSQKPYMRIYGPPNSWRTVRPEAYKGQLPFDGSSVQKEYARFGVGLICLGYEHLMDDIISNRVFEISSVGAASISPDTPWMRKHFGDSVLYYDPFSSIETIVEQIDAAFRQIQADPRAATERAAKARAIFEERFHAGAMLRGAVDHFERWKAASTPASAVKEAAVDVIVRGAGEGLTETLASLRRQRGGRLRVLSIGGATGSIEGVEVESFADLSAALAAVTAPSFAILKAGERLLSHHFERLLPPLIAGGAVMAYADALAPETPGTADLAICAQGPAGGDVGEVLRRLPLACLLMDSSMARFLLTWRGLADADDRMLAARVLAAGRSEHWPGPTCILPTAPVACADDLESRLVLSLETAPFLAALRANAPAQRPSLLKPIADAVTDIGEAKLDAIAAERVFEGGMIGRDVRDRDDVVYVDVPLNAGRLTGVADYVFTDRGSVRFHPEAAFDISLQIDLEDLSLLGCPPTAIFGLASANDALFLGLLDQEGEIIARTITPKSRKALQVWVNGPPETSAASAIVQAWKRPPSEPVELLSLTLAYRLPDLALALATPDLTQKAGAAWLIERARTETVGAPPGPSPQLEDMAIRHPRSAFPHPAFEHGETGAVVTTGRKPWDYFAQIFVPAVAEETILNLSVESAEESFTAFLVNTAFDEVLGPRLQMRGGKEDSELWIPGPAPNSDAFLILQAGPSPYDRTVALKRLSRALVDAEYRP